MNENEKAVARRTARLMRAARKRRGLTQQEMARILSTSQANVSKLENGVLIPSALEWFDFCATTGVSPESLRTGYLERKEPILLRSDRFEAGFALPKHYAENRASKIRAAMPLLTLFETELGLKKLEAFCKAHKIDSDLFVDLDNQVSMNLFLDLSRALISEGALRPKNLGVFTQAIESPATHGSLLQDYQAAGKAILSLAALVRNSAFYEANFKYEIESQSANELSFSVAPRPHLESLEYRNDAVLENFLCQYKKNYFQTFASIGLTRPATVRESECHFKGASRCVYHLRVAS